MKIPQSVRNIYADLRPKYDRLQNLVDELIKSRKNAQWHYFSRVKSEESFSLKLETGRLEDPMMPDDLFGCTIVVENYSKIQEAEARVLSLFDLHIRKPNSDIETHLEPHSFDFDDLRLYVKWKDDPSQRPTGLGGTIFEIQIKTFLQHAWGIATHDFIYKTNQVDWPKSRIAFQVKAMLENAELSIGEASNLTASDFLKKEDKTFSNLSRIITSLQQRWRPEQLPSDLRRLAMNIMDLSKALNLSTDDIWRDLDEASAAGEGIHTLNLSPYGSVMSALIRKRGVGLFGPLGWPKARRRVFVPVEISLPALSSQVAKKIIRSGVSSPAIPAAVIQSSENPLSPSFEQPSS